MSAEFIFRPISKSGMNIEFTSLVLKRREPISRRRKILMIIAAWKRASRLKSKFLSVYGTDIIAIRSPSSLKIGAYSNHKVRPDTISLLMKNL